MVNRERVIAAIKIIGTQHQEAFRMQTCLRNMDREKERRWPWPDEVEMWWLAPGMRLNGNLRGHR